MVDIIYDKVALACTGFGLGYTALPFLIRIRL